MKTYISSKIYDGRETKEEFIERIKKEAKERQLVTVFLNRKKESVVFGAEGNIITSWGRFKIISAKVLFGK